MDRSAPERHDAVADELIDRARLLRYCVRDGLKIDRQLREQIIRCLLFCKSGEILQVREEHRHETLFDTKCQRSSRLDQLPDYIQRYERREGTQRSFE